MSARWTEQELEAYLANRRPSEQRQVPRSEHHASKPTKYRNIPTIGQTPEGERKFPSKAEKKMADLLEADRAAGNILTWIPQVSCPIGILNGKYVRHIIDGLVIYSVQPDGVFVGRFLECKGRDLAAGRAKRGAFELLYRVPVEVWK